MVQRDKRPPVNKPVTERITDFSGGLNTTISGSLLNSNEAQVAEDVSFEQKGTIVPRRGRKKRYSSSFTNEGCTGIGAYYKKDGTSRLLISSGDKLFSDKPHISTKYDTKADWDKEGTYKTTYLDTSSYSGSLRIKNNLLESIGSFENGIDNITAVDVTLVEDTSKKKFDATSLKITIATGKSVGYAKISKTFITGLDSDKPYAFSAYVLNGNVSNGIRLVTLDSSNTVKKSGSYITDTSNFVKTTLKLSQEDIVNADSFALEVSGSAGQYAYTDGLVLLVITDVEYADSGYVAPDYSYFIPTTKIVTYTSKADFDSGTGINIDTSSISGSIIPTKGVDVKQDDDLSIGTSSNILITSVGSIIVDTGVTFESYVNMTFDELIAL